MPRICVAMGLMLVMLAGCGPRYLELCRDSSLTLADLENMHGPALGKPRSYVYDELGEPVQKFTRVAASGKAVVEEVFSARDSYESYDGVQEYNAKTNKFETVYKKVTHYYCARLSVGYFAESDKVISTVLW